MMHTNLYYKIGVLTLFSVYPGFSSNENARNSNYLSVYFI